ncbi:MAG: hypothetical protein LBQ06_06325 [Frankiaceae bacterium]|nr:hypothetical protein [Frankiaceae bacterium]
MPADPPQPPRSPGGADPPQPPRQPGAAEPFAAPRQVRIAAGLAAAQGGCLLIAAGYLLIRTLFGQALDVGRGGWGGALALLGAAMLIFGAKGLLRGSTAARTPVLVIEALSLPVGYSLGIQAHRIWYGGPIMASAVAVIVLLLGRAARAALDREI